MAVNMAEWQWIRHRNPTNQYAATFTLGTREVELPPDAIISLTLGDRFSIWRMLTNGIITQFIQRQMLKSEGLLYAELDGDATTGSSLTLSVWSGKSMTKFRDSGAHKFAKNFFSWVFYSGKTEVYFLTCAAKGRIPTTEEGYALARQLGRRVDGGVEVRATRQPHGSWYEALGSQPTD